MTLKVSLKRCTIPSKVRWFKEGEKPTRFFFKLEHERIQWNYISSILNSDGIEVRFYSDLFSEEPVDACCKQSCLTGIEKHLSFSQQQACEGFLTLQELTESVKSLNLGKSPGSDGLSAESYLHFWETFSALLINVFLMVTCVTL